MIVYIGGIEREVLNGTLNINDAIGERSTASFTVRDLTGELSFYKGQPVYIDNVFSGVIDNVKEKAINPSGAKFHMINCVDWHYLCDKRIIAKAYANMLAGDIVKDIIINYLAAEGITYTYGSTVEEGGAVVEAVFNYVPISQAMDVLAEKAGFWWYIDSSKKLHFKARTSVTAPFEINSDVVIGNPILEKGNSQYRNKQYIRGGTDETDPLTETRTGDGETKSFALGFKIARVPTIQVSISGGAWTEQSVGIKGIDTGKQWYWAKGDAVITQDSAEAALTSSDRVRITYRGQFPVVAITWNQEEIDNRQAIEGTGTGIVEHVDDEPQSTNREAAFEIANKKLEKYAVIGRRLIFRTRHTGLRPGQLATVNLPIYNLINTEMLIESINISNEGPIVWYDVTAVEGPEQGSWTRLFAAMATKGQSFIIRENVSEDEVITSLAVFSKIWEQIEHPNIFHELYAGETVFPSVNTFPMFAYTDRVKYLVIFNSSGVELERKKITKQTGEETGVITSITYLAPWEANGEIAELAWIGGNLDNIEVDRKTYVRTKTSLEAMQIDKTDTRNFTPAFGTTQQLSAAYLNGLEDNIEALLIKTV